jgi:hypothetical protein
MCILTNPIDFEFKALCKLFMALIYATNWTEEL